MVKHEAVTLPQFELQLVLDWTSPQTDNLAAVANVELPI